MTPLPQPDWRTRPPKDTRPQLWRWIAIALVFVVLKLWLVEHLPIRALDADRDNLRYVILAGNLINGDTSYDAFALLRQPGYPFTIALAHWLGMPLRLWQEMLYLIGGGVLAGTIAALYRRPRIATLCFGLYAIAPFSFHWNRQTVQEVLYLPLMAVWLAGAIAVIQCRRVWWGALGGGVALAVLWNTRPEGILLVPPIALVWAIVAWRRYQEQRDVRQRAQRSQQEQHHHQEQEAEAQLEERLERAIDAELEARFNGLGEPPVPSVVAAEVLEMPLEILTDIRKPLDLGAIAREVALGLVLTIAPVVLLTVGIGWSNAANFGLFATSDFKTPEFDAAYSALSRVEVEAGAEAVPNKNAAIVPVPAAARAAIYKHSPAFEELRPSLEVAQNEGWRSQSCGAGVCADYAAGFFFWALRDAVDAAGYYDSPDRAAAFYTQLTIEVNAACDRGALTCRSGVWGMVPALRWQTLPQWWGSLHRLSRQLWQTALVLKIGAEPSDSSAEMLALRSRYYAPIIGEPADFAQRRSRPIDQRKDRAITIGANLYRALFPVVIGLSVLGLAIEGGIQLGQRGRSRDRGQTSPSIPLILVLVALVTIACRVVTIAYIDVTSWPVGAGDRYLRPLWPLLWFVVTAGLSYAVDRWRPLLRPDRRPRTSRF